MSQPTTNQAAAFPRDVLANACARLQDRGIDPEHTLGKSPLGHDVDVTWLYATLGRVAVGEKAGQGPTHATARLAVQSGLPSEIADTLFLAYNQQSAEEAGHGDKVFGNAYYALGGTAAGTELNVLPDPDASGLRLIPGDDPKQNKEQLAAFAAILGGVETVVLQHTFPALVSLCERWDHLVIRDLLTQIRDVVRPEESRHVLLFRYVFHRLVADQGEAAIAAFMDMTNVGRAQLGAAGLNREAFDRLVGTSAPTRRQLFGKRRPLAS